MKENIKNIAHSIKQRLDNEAKKNNIEFNFLLIQYLNERLLYRLSISRYSENFILKGALLFLAHNIGRLRPTKDIDLLGNSIANDSEIIKEIFEEISNINYEDGVIFKSHSISVEQINGLDEYHGVRLKIDSSLDSMKQRIQIDIGFGDIVYPQPVFIDFPVILDMESPKILAYSLETSISEKFEAIISLGLANSRMKDFYDIYYLASTRNFISSDLATSIKETFKRRNTKLENRISVFNDSFLKDKDKQQMWIAFLNRNKISLNLTFEEILANIQLFLEPVLIQNENLKWNPTQWIWTLN